MIKQKINILPPQHFTCKSPILKKYGSRWACTWQISKTKADGKTRPTYVFKIQQRSLKKSEAIMDARYFRCSYFWSLSKPQKKSPEIIAPKNSIIILAHTPSIIKEKTKKEPCGTGGKRVSHVISWRVHQEPRISCFRRLSATTSTKKKPHVRPTRPEIGYCIGRRGRARRHSIPFSAIRGTYNSRYFLEN